VEYTVVHGLRNKEGSGQLDIEFEKQDDQLVCTIVDNGIGQESMDVKKGLRHSEDEEILGVTALKSRLMVLNSLYDNSYDLEIIDLKGENNTSTGTKMIITCPIMYEDEFAKNVA